MSKRRSCAVCAVRQRALCATIARDLLLRVNRVACQRRYATGQFILAAGQPQAWFATVLSGVVKLTKAMADGRQQIVGLLFAADFLGRPFADASPYGAEAATPVELCCVERGYFEDQIVDCPGMRQRLLEQTLSEVDAARDWMLLLGRKTAEEKVASLIVLMANRMRASAAADPPRGEAARYELPLSRTEMAEYLCLRLETVSRQLARLRAAGVIETENGRTITVRDVGALGRIAGREPA